MIKFKTIVSVCILVAVVATCGVVHAKELKIATLAPLGSTQYNLLDAAAKDVAAKTAGRVTIKIFGGGVQGDEKDVVRKMRYGELDGAALTGVGLGLIDPQIRVLELPFLFSNDTQVDKVSTGLKPYFTKQYSAKGFELLGWVETGFVKIFSNRAIKNRADLSGMKMWMWEGDPLAQEMYTQMGVTPVPLAITDVLTSLQTNLIDAVYAPELGAIAMQWQTKVKFMTDVNLVNGTGGILFSSKSFKAISAADQAVVRDVIAARAAELVQRTRADNLASKAAVQASGIQLVNLDEQGTKELDDVGVKVRENLVGKLYSRELLDQVLQMLK